MPLGRNISNNSAVMWRICGISVAVGRHDHCRVIPEQVCGDCPWIHLDIASTDWSERERAYLPKGPTGIGTRLLIQFLLDRPCPSGNRCVEAASAEHQSLLTQIVIVGGMTLREQIGQLFMMGFMGTTVSKDLASFITAYKPGGVIFSSQTSNRSSKLSI